MTDLFTERDKKKAKAFVKGANTGIAQILGFPVDMVNMAPLLLNLLPGKQGMKPFSDNPLGGSQTFKDLMAAGVFLATSSAAPNKNNSFKASTPAVSEGLIKFLPK